MLHPLDETLYPNDSSCRRFAQVTRAFAQRAADKWNNTDDMEYLNKLIGKWMPEPSKRVAVDSHPRLSGIMDTLNSTLAHGPETRLPKEFYDLKGRAIIDKIATEEWFSGYKESEEYRVLGIGGLMGDVVSRMVGFVRHSGGDGLLEIGGKTGSTGTGRGGEKDIKFALSGCHDTTLAAVLSSLGAFDGEAWPPYTSHVALELFRKTHPSLMESKNASASSTSTGWFSSFRGKSPQQTSIARRKISELSETEKSKLEGYYVRLRYNDKVMRVPGCKAPGKHLEGDDSFCTLVSCKVESLFGAKLTLISHVQEEFKNIVDKFTPANWKQACLSNLDSSAFPQIKEPAGY
jgi:acid phosphatase